MSNAKFSMTENNILFNIFSKTFLSEENCVPDFVNDFFNNTKDTLYESYFDQKIKNGSSVNLSKQDVNILNKYVAKRDLLIKNLINKNPFVIKYLNNQSEELCRIALKNNENVFKVIQNPTEQITNFALKIDGSLIRFVKNQTDKMKKIAAVDRNTALMHITNPSAEIEMLAVKHDGFAIKYVKEQTLELCLAAVRQNPGSIVFIQDITEDLINIAVSSREDLKDLIEELLALRLANQTSQSNCCNIQ